MSKAFTSEETPEAVPLVRAPPRLAPGEVRYITPEGQAALRAELSRLEAERERLRALPEPERTGLAELEARRGLVEATLAALTVLGPEGAPEGKVAFATWVTLEDEAGARQRWRIVGPDEADARQGKISVDSPLARALLGRREGETVEVQRPQGARELTVISVRRTPPEEEAPAGDPAR